MSIKLNPRKLETSYILFALKTRMLNDIRTAFGDNISVLFNRKIVAELFDIELYSGGVKQIIWNTNKIQIIIDKWMINHSNYCLIMCKDFKIDGIPSSWINDMIPTITIADYHTRLDKGGLYIKLNSLSDYSSTYNDFSLKIVESLRCKYKEGYVFGYNSIADSWNLESLGYDFFKPRWSNCIYAHNMVNFLTDRLIGNSDISFNIGTKNNVDRHFIASDLSGCKFISDRLIIKSDEYKDAENICDYISRTIRDSHGSVDISYHKKIENSEGIWYETDNIYYPFTLSKIVDN